MDASTPIVALEGVDFAYPGAPPLFRGLDFALCEGQRIGLHGPNGCGKTTLLRIILGLERPSAGKVLHRGRVVEGRGAWRRLRLDVGLVMQNSDDQLFSATVLEDVAFGPLNMGMDRRAARARAMDTLAALDLEHLAERATHRLSGGEKKMVAIATVLSMDPGALLLDEPVAGLDDEATERIAELLSRRGGARVVVSHDRPFLARAADSFVRLAPTGALEAAFQNKPH